MKYPALAVTALAALYASGWLGALLLSLAVVALWRAGEPADLDADPWVRAMRVLREGR